MEWKADIKYEKRFLDKVQKTETCWIWTGSKNQHGYGNFWYGEKCKKAHRISYMAFVGSLNDSLDVMHKCDNPSCVNPEHLVMGTTTDNIRDMWKKGRGDPRHNENNVRAKLKPSDIEKIRYYDKCGIPSLVISYVYDMSPSQVRRIIRKAKGGWTHGY